jgi:hypothetical protein
LSSSQITSLDNQINDDEIQKVFFSLKDNKAPRPDDFNIGFFKEAWSIIGQDTLAVVWSFFNSGRLLKQVNATTIALTPNVANPSRVKDFRSISCCNTIYKCIAKIIVNTVKRVLLDFVAHFSLLL